MYVMLSFCFPKAPLPRVNCLLLKCLSSSYSAQCLRGSNAVIGVNRIKSLCYNKGGGRLNMGQIES